MRYPGKFTDGTVPIFCSENGSDSLMDAGSGRQYLDGSRQTSGPPRVT